MQEKPLAAREFDLHPLGNRNERWSFTTTSGCCPKCLEYAADLIQIAVEAGEIPVFVSTEEEIEEQVYCEDCEEEIEFCRDVDVEVDTTTEVSLQIQVCKHCLTDLILGEIQC